MYTVCGVYTVYGIKMGSNSKSDKANIILIYKENQKAKQKTLQIKQVNKAKFFYLIQTGQITFQYQHHTN